MSVLQTNLELIFNKWASTYSTDIKNGEGDDYRLILDANNEPEVNYEKASVHNFLKIAESLDIVIDITEDVLHEIFIIWTNRYSKAVKNDDVDTKYEKILDNSNNVLKNYAELSALTFIRIFDSIK